MAELRLKRVDGPEKYKVEGRIALGRHHENDIVLNAEGVSRRHCVVEVDADGNVFVEDLGSANGTFVNGQPIQRVQVQVNDELQVGVIKYVFLEAAAKTEAPPPVARYQSILLHPHFSEKISGVLLQSLEDSSEQYLWPVDSISTIGRLKFSNLCLNDGSVSRNHAKVEIREHRAIVSDMNSTNGTYVNDKRVIQKELKDGDILGIGRFNFKLKFSFNKEDSFASLQKILDYQAINVQEDMPKLLEFFQEEFGDQVLSEVERQTLLLCEELDSILNAADTPEARRGSLATSLRLLSHAEHALDADSLRARIVDKAGLDSLPLETLQGADRVMSTMQDPRLVYFEETYPGHPTIIQINGCLVNFSDTYRPVLFGVPYENMLYLLYASNWLSQVQVNA
jgi:pSer/pThr/pTyr-binding forkhead associated (FHA) protein